MRRGFAEDPAARDLDKVLLVTSTAGVAAVAGPGAVAALAAYPVEPGRTVLPSLGVGLSGGCYLQWRGWPPRPTRARRRRPTRRVRGSSGRSAASSWSCSARCPARIEAVQRALTGVLAEAVDHGILLA